MQTTDEHEHYRRGIQLLQEERFEEAVEALHRAATTGKDYPLEHYALARALEKVGRLEESVQEYECFLRMNPQESQYTQHAKQRVTELKAQTEDTTRSHRPNNEIDALHRQGLNALDKGELEDAERFFNQAISLQGDHVPTLIDMSVLAFRKGCMKAADILKRSAEYQPDSTTIWFNLGLVLLRAGRRSEASEMFAKVLELDPTDSQASSLLEEADRRR